MQQREPGFDRSRQSVTLCAVYESAWAVRLSWRRVGVRGHRH